ncbi:hypothetical protein, partial [Streptomyces prunicolor]|uniref:hypothetical protein n=1 Tax=Streptomyces prunicolor TaxID=67348 RepID=UPI00340A32CC
QSSGALESEVLGQFAVVRRHRRLNSSRDGRIGKSYDKPPYDKGTRRWHAAGPNVDLNVS